MITLHRLGHAVEPFQLNPDLIMTVEANPDTVITLTTGTKIVVAEAPDRVADDVRCYRIDVLAGALARRAQLRASGAQVHKAASLHVVPSAAVLAHPAAVEHHTA
jgi:flagellar protein FlbD